MSEYKRVDKFVYLRSIVENSTEVRCKWNLQEMDALLKLSVTWKRHVISCHAKLILLKAVMFPVYFYGQETLTIEAEDHTRIGSFQTWDIRAY